MPNSNYAAMLLISEVDWNKMKKLYDERKITNIHSQSIESVKDKQLPPDQYIKAVGTLKDRQDIKQETKPVLKSLDKKSWVEDAIELLPKNFRSRAKQIYFFLKQQNTFMSWTDKGELETPQHGIVQGTNILDLISYLTSNQTRNEPFGLNIFIDVIRNLNLPKTLLSQQGIKAINKTNNHHQNDEEMLSDTWYNM